MNLGTLGWWINSDYPPSINYVNLNAFKWWVGQKSRQVMPFTNLQMVAEFNLSLNKTNTNWTPKRFFKCSDKFYNWKGWNNFWKSWSWSFWIRSIWVKLRNTWFSFLPNFPPSHPLIFLIHFHYWYPNILYQAKYCWYVVLGAIGQVGPPGPADGPGRSGPKGPQGTILSVAVFTNVQIKCLPTR